MSLCDRCYAPGNCCRQFELANFEGERSFWIADGLNSNADLFKVIGPIPPWTECAMVQYAADGAGPQPHQEPGVQNGADLSAFLGTRDQLALLFAGKPSWDQAPATTTEPAPVA